jgi:hypothetical protein
MRNLLKLNSKTVVILYMLIDVICMGIGMGVPIFCILLGFPMGWFITKRVSVIPGQLYEKYYQILKYSMLTVLFTFIQMLVVWGKTIPMLFDRSSDFQNFGHPYILYDPKISFIGWSILMIIVSPFLQLLTTIFAAFITLIRSEKKLKQRSV